MADRCAICGTARGLREYGPVMVMCRTCERPVLQYERGLMSLYELIWRVAQRASRAERARQKARRNG